MTIAAGAGGATPEQRAPPHRRRLRRTLRQYRSGQERPALSATAAEPARMPDANIIPAISIPRPVTGRHSAALRARGHQPPFSPSTTFWRSV
ncbi:hypothetical protein J4732_11505 [Serratia marcescens]|uniref:Uncharacterized protein n=1 Tax=Serratia marcescens TaxID=615 RepID=A0A939SV90_SERMA|nr:hypothetical protein [Serratia marcescens]